MFLFLRYVFRNDIVFFLCVFHTLTKFVIMCRLHFICNYICHNAYLALMGPYVLMKTLASRAYVR